MENSKKVPNISHLPVSQADLFSILIFLHRVKSQDTFIDFLKSVIIKKRLDKTDPFKFISKDSTERKWVNHLKEVGIIEIKNKEVAMSNLSSDLVNSKISLDEYIYSTIKSSENFKLLFNDLIDLSFLSNNFTSIRDLFGVMQKEFNYIDRFVSAERNLIGMLNYISISTLIIKDKDQIILFKKPFLQESELKKIKSTTFNFILNNSNYGGYANIVEVLNYLIEQFPKYKAKQIELLLKRIMTDENIALQEASSNKESGISFMQKNILFIRVLNQNG